MPNHVQNRLIFPGEETLKEVICRLSKKNIDSLDNLDSNELFDFKWIIPPPSTKEELIKVYGEKYLYTKENGNLIQVVDEKPWFNWYRWQTDHWGTKWNCYDTFVNCGSLYFHTAWVIPKPIIEKISKLLPDIPFRYQWAEEQGGYYCGKMDHNLNDEDCWVYFDEYSDEAYEMYNELWGEVFYKTVNHEKWVNVFDDNIFEVEGDFYDYDLDQADLEEAKEYHKIYGKPFDIMINNAWKDTHDDWLKEIGIKE